jgi:hypothetical protein
MKFIKSHLKLTIGILALGLAAVLFFVAMQSQGNLEEGTLQKWLSASDSRRIAAAQILSGSDENTDLLVGCISRMAQMHDAANVKVRDAVSLCAVGITLKGVGD